MSAGTRRCMRRLAAIVALSTLALAAGRGLAAGTAQDTPKEPERAENSVRLGFGDRPELVYRFDSVPKKPYMEKLFSPAGVNVLRDSPRDHVHHHGLMFALEVDGVDFWSEVPKEKMGREVHGGFVPADFKPSAERLPARLCEKLDWQRPDGETLLVEERAVRVHGEVGPEATLVSWASRLSAAAGKPSARLTGRHYFGLGMRLAASMDKEGEFLLADASRSEAIRGSEQVVRSRWAAYTAQADGQPVTVALFDHPDNVRHPAGIFIMDKPFAYLSATLGLHREPLVLEAEKPLQLRYGVAVWDGSVKPEKIESLYRRWLRLNKTPVDGAVPNPINR